MITTAIIAEYNPFHNGHLYQIQRAKELTNADNIIVIMSGNFVQRGEPAIISKWARAKTALLSGVDLVVELPVCYATGSAEYFAKGSISILNQLGIVDYLCFGSECGDISSLMKPASILANEPEPYKTLLQKELKSGNSYPLVRKKALKMYCQEINVPFDISVLDTPNNILGMEYCKALLATNSSIKPVTIQRIGGGYHDRTIHEELSSASAIRNLLSNESHHLQTGTNKELKPPTIELKKQLSEISFQILIDEIQKHGCMICQDFNDLLFYKLLSLNDTKSKYPYADYLDISEDFSDKILKNLLSYESFDSFCGFLKSKDLTYTRICRNLLHILLEIKKDDVNAYLDSDTTFYARVLGLNKTKEELTKSIKANSSIPLITQPAKAQKLLTPLGYQQFQTDIFASQLYESVKAGKNKLAIANEFTNQIIIVS